MYQVDASGHPGRPGRRHLIDGDMPSETVQAALAAAETPLPRGRGCHRPIRPVEFYPEDEPLPGPRRRCTACFPDGRLSQGVTPEFQVRRLAALVDDAIETARDQDPWMLGELLLIRHRLTVGADEIVKALRERGTPWETIGADIRNFRSGRPLGKVATRNRFARRIGELDDGEEQTG